MNFALLLILGLWTSILSAQEISQKLLLVGGGKRPEAALSAWVGLTAQYAQQHQKSSAHVLVITWASEIPEEVFEDLKADFSSAGTAVKSSLLGPKTASEKKLLLKQISETSGIFFSGGNQLRIMDVLKDPELLTAIQQAYWSRGLPFGGTSAGTAIMSEVMILGDGKGVGKGLGFLPQTVVDQHFLKRNRVERLAEALKSAPPGFLGVGVDEDGAILWQNAPDQQQFKGQVIGDKQVMLMRPGPTGKVETTLLQPGQRTEWNIQRNLKGCNHLFE